MGKQGKQRDSREKQRLNAQNKPAAAKKGISKTPIGSKERRGHTPTAGAGEYAGVVPEKLRRATRLAVYHLEA